MSNAEPETWHATPRTASVAEARAVVTLAATIVQWHREAWVVQRR
jgi:hypothetical protein